MLHPKSRIHVVPVDAIALALILVLAVAPAVATAAPISMPKDIRMVQPDPSLPEALAAFSGKWEGSGYHCGPTFPIQMFIIVEKITKEKVSLYVFYSPIGWNRREANVTIEDGEYKLWYISFAGRCEMTLRANELVYDAQPSWFTLGLKRVP